MRKKNLKKIVVCIENREKLLSLKKLLSNISNSANFTYRNNLQKLREDNDLFSYSYVVLGQPQGKDFFSEDVLIGGDESLSAESLFSEVKIRLGLETENADSKKEKVENLTNKFLKRVEDSMRNDIDYSDQEVYALIEGIVNEDELLSRERKQLLSRDIFNIIRRFDVLTEYLEDSEITEIMVNGTDNIFIERDSKLIKVHKRFESKDRLRNIINKMVSDAGRQIDEANPIVDARLADGSRVNAVLEPIAINGPSLTIRRFPKAFNLQMLVDNDSITQEAADFLSSLVKSKYNIFVSGSTGSGKTTLLNCLSECIDSDERIVTIEDSAELQISHIPNIIKMEVRIANSNGKGSVTISDLIKNSLRMRPDRIIVGEVRREEAYDMLQAMNTGHDGSLSTGHANSANDMMRRLETMILTNSTIPLPAIRGTIESAIDIVVHLSRLRDKKRKIVEICEVDGFEPDGNIRLVPLFSFDDKEGKLVKKKELKNTTKLKIRGLHKEKVKCEFCNPVIFNIGERIN